MINYGPMEVSFIISVLMLLLYYLDDGKSVLRYLLILIIYVISLIVVLGDQDNDIYAITCLMYLMFLSRRMLNYVFPKGQLNSGVPLDGFTRSKYRAKLNKWEETKSRNVLYMVYCLAFMLGIISINYF